MRRIGVGIIGVGKAGRAQLEAILRLGFAELRAIAVRDGERARGLCEEFGIARSFGDYREMLDDPGIEVLHNCTPNHQHFAINRAILESGKHLVSEKPLGLDSAESLILWRLAGEGKAVNAVNFVYRHHALVQHLRGMIEAGELGTIRAVSGAYLQDWLLYDSDYDWRVEAALGGASRAMADIGSHWVDLAQFLLGRNVVEVCADFATFVPRRAKPGAGGPTMVEVDTEDYAAVLCRFEGGAHGSFTVSQASAGSRLGLWIQVDGSLASARWSQERAHELWIGHRDRANEVIVSHPSLLNARALACCRVDGEGIERWPDAQKSMIAAVYRSILEGAEPSY
ncbi:MAG TPA: Gfo/Idh/MocA family oxidoreductase, partial [Rectinemataceae bacterium]|nr:Gfo/Idh/MocA family oxidoreductase [Rectinemataceae bacterium]